MRHRDRRRRAGLTVTPEEAGEIGVEELVPVEGIDVAAPPARLRREAQASPAAERLRLGDGDDLRAEAGELGLEEPLLSGGAAHEHALDARAREQHDLVGGQRTPPDRNEGLRPPLRGRAETLCPATG